MYFEHKARHCLTERLAALSEARAFVLQNNSRDLFRDFSYAVVGIQSTRFGSGLHPATKVQLAEEVLLGLGYKKVDLQAKEQYFLREVS